MVRRIFLGIMMAVMISFTSLPSKADGEGEARVVLGADLSEQEILGIYEDFGISRGSVTELTVTNQEERTYLTGLVPDEKIGSRSLSSIYILTTSQEAGLEVTTYNINWCTEAIYKNALMTAGVEHAKVVVSAPFGVSGTAALTGIYKAYEDMTGTPLSQMAKEVAAEELVMTSTLADAIGSEAATALVNELKMVLDETKDMSDQALRDLIIQLAKDQNVTLTDSDIDQLISLVRSLEKLDIGALKDKLDEVARTLEQVKKASQGMSGILEKAGDILSNLGDMISDFFQGLISFFKA